MKSQLEYFLEHEDARREDFAAWAMAMGFAGAGADSDWNNEVCLGMWAAYKAGRDFAAGVEL